MLVQSTQLTSQVWFRPNDPNLIAMIAYSLWEARGRPFGSPEEDWLMAERELRALIV